jgi:hypothetical protein
MLTRPIIYIRLVAQNANDANRLPRASLRAATPLAQMRFYFTPSIPRKHVPLCPLARNSTSGSGPPPTFDVFEVARHADEAAAFAADLAGGGGLYSRFMR